ncbi:TylF/MycF/NovP-related O-methyltransferase [Mycolicibacterium vinylchloridicum]|uniref:TylF/MycF/NovP-related O-methyltransferase n=1 Tax=Mycolicibacterium vinylchloridicum TaxID=2736928 RepID=UPI0015C968B6|nr:TylF/MycF/NovP-related O-methyltransferase [Mycolicibacterium vinylchloridicum]
MNVVDFSKLIEDLDAQLLAGAQRVGILGLTPETLKIARHLHATGIADGVESVYVPRGQLQPSRNLPFAVCAIDEIGTVEHDVIVVATDRDKEDLLFEALQYIKGSPKVIVAGYGHLSFRDASFEKLVSDLMVPSLANGYPNTLVHLYQCLGNAARLNLQGVVAEFGVFKGGTTMFLSKTIESLGMSWPIIGFDTFNGFPPRRSPLDMYDHPDCEFTDLDAVTQYLSGRNIELVAGDVVETAQILSQRDIVLTFIDTDNYTSAVAAINAVKDRTVLGGAIVFDHFTGVDKFRYTLGERMAGQPLLGDPRYFNLHGTGVFYRQR